MSESVEGNAIESVAEEAPPERRREYRLNRMLGAVLGSGEDSVRARIFVINISRTGLKATHEFRLPELERQALSLFLSAKDGPLEMQVKIAWQKELVVSGMFEVGFQFLEMSDEDARRLEEFIAREAHREEGRPVDLSSPWKFGKHG